MSRNGAEDWRLGPGRRDGDSRYPAAPAWVQGSETRPRVGTSRTYQGREVEANNYSKIGGLSPGPCYKYEAGVRTEVDGASNYRAPPAYSFGGTRVEIDKRLSPGPCNYGFAQAPSLGYQRINSTSHSDPRWGFGSSTREDRDKVHIAKGRLFSNNLPSASLVFGGAPELPGTKTEFAESTKSGTTAPSREQLGRALAVALTAKQAASDPLLAGALSSLRNRVATLQLRQATQS